MKSLSKYTCRCSFDQAKKNSDFFYKIHNLILQCKERHAEGGVRGVSTTPMAKLKVVDSLVGRLQECVFNSLTFKHPPEGVQIFVCASRNPLGKHLCTVLNPNLVY